MAKDYAKTTRAKKKKAATHWLAKAGAWLLIFIGGYLAASYFDFNRIKHVVKQKVASALPTVAPSTAHEVPKPVEIPKPKFEFYTILPKQKANQAPGAKPKDEKVAASTVVKDKLPQDIKKRHDGKQYLLQAASFKRLSDADKLKAQLTLKGFEVSIRAFSSQGNTWHRVTLGPFPSLKKVVAVQAQLSKDANINGMVKRTA